MAANFECINSIEVLEKNGESTSHLTADPPVLIIKNHYKEKSLVVIEGGTLLRITVRGDDLIRAIKNAQNTHFK